MHWDRDRAIESYKAALIRIVASLIALAGLSDGGTLERLPRPLYRAILKVLRPAEAAVRRLIVIAARGVVATPYPVRPLPAGFAISGAGAGSARLSFPLFDPRKRFDVAPRRAAGPRLQPRIHSFANSPLVPIFQLQPQPPAEPESDDTVAAARLGRRLAAVKLALDTLPRQVKRMARWQARRNRMAGFVFRSPLRPGPPPGIHEPRRHEVEEVLERCHFLAFEALRPNTS